jgi:hypothetical protein
LNFQLPPHPPLLDLLVAFFQNKSQWIKDVVVYRGSIGKVKLGIHKETGFKVAIKIFSKQRLNTDITWKKKIEKEIAIMVCFQ